MGILCEYRRGGSANLVGAQGNVGLGAAADGFEACGKCVHGFVSGGSRLNPTGETKPQAGMASRWGGHVAVESACGTSFKDAAARIAGAWRQRAAHFYEVGRLGD